MSANAVAPVRASSSTTPARPTARPTTVRAAGVSRRCAQSKSVIHNGSVATNSAATPDASRVSAHASAPYAQPNISAPATIACRHARQPVRSPRAAAHASSSAPAATHRTPIIRSGGMESTASRMARNVEPQMR